MGCRTLKDVLERGHPNKIQQVGRQHAYRLFASCEPPFCLVLFCQIGIAYYDELHKRMPRAEVERLIATIRAALDTVDPQLELVRPMRPKAE